MCVCIYKIQYNSTFVKVYFTCLYFFVCFKNVYRRSVCVCMHAPAYVFVYIDAPLVHAFCCAN